MVVLATGDVTRVAGPIRAEVGALDAGMPVRNVRALERAYEMVAIGQQSLVFQMLTFIGLLATVLTIVGLYGVVAYLTTLRTHEIGIRMALGAGRPTILVMVLQQAATMAGPGLVAGIGLAYLLTPAFAFAFNFAPRDVRGLAAASLVLVVTAIGASLIPARRAMRLSPTVALKEE